MMYIYAIICDIIYIHDIIIKDGDSIIKYVEGTNKIVKSWYAS